MIRWFIDMAVFHVTLKQVEIWHYENNEIQAILPFQGFKSIEIEIILCELYKSGLI